VRWLVHGNDVSAGGAVGRGGAQMVSSWRCRALERVREGTRVASIGMLVRKTGSWHVPQTKTWIPGMVNFAVVTLLASLIHDTVWKRCG